MLGFLVAAMTGTSLLLGWMAPSTAPAAERALTTILEDARQAVVKGVVGGPRRWHGLEVTAGPVVSLSGTLLTASSQVGGFHFEVDLLGRIVPTEHWLRQKSLPEGSDSIRIQILRQGPDHPMSRAQWDCVRALVTALREMPPHQQTDFPVQLDATWADVYGLTRESTIHIGPLAVAGG